MSHSDIQTQCCIAGGGPAGMMLGLLLARAGVQVVVLEKHADFLRDFRGDTVHPSTLEVMHELGLLDRFLAHPHQRLEEIGGRIAGQRVRIADFSHLPTHARFIALMPQWDFLNFIAEEARRHPSFRLCMQSEVTQLIQRGDAVVGLRARGPQGEFEVQAALSIGADGRSSLVRSQAGLLVEDLGAPMDVLWMRLSKRDSDSTQALGYVGQGHVLVLLDRGDYWQCAFVIPKGQFDELQREPIAALHREIEALVPFLGDRTHELGSWQDVRLLTVKVDRLRQWYRPGLLCIGDAAHAMSPIGGVGINLAIQDAVATANLLAPALRGGHVPPRALARVQRRRELPTRLTQSAQLGIQNGLIRPALAGQPPSVPLLARVLEAVPPLRRVSARMLGLGVRPEHVDAALRSPAA
ncbi:MAG TPA: FAD-dependent oxidoreductase [Polyangiaceae bacterium]|nr:FAD-dependent oxidoreductase [Polyangiaceae bacterium]